MNQVKITGLNRMFPPLGEICNFDRLFLFDSYLLNLSSNFTKMLIFES